MKFIVQYMIRCTARIYYIQIYIICKVLYYVYIIQHNTILQHNTTILDRYSDIHTVLKITRIEVRIRSLHVYTCIYIHNETPEGRGSLRARKNLFFSPWKSRAPFPAPPALGPRFIRCKTMNILNRVEKWIFPAARIRAIFPVKNQRERKRARRALPGISLSTRERARFIIDTVGGRTSARANARRSTGKQCTRTRVEIFYVAFFNLILQQRHVFITPLFDRGNRQRVARAIFDPTPPTPILGHVSS